jgi:hypothetical protein
MNDRVNGITSNTTNSLSNQERSSSIMSDLESIVKIGVHIIYEELVEMIWVMMSLIYGVNDLNDVSRPMGLHPKGMMKIMTKLLTKVDDLIPIKVDTGMNQEYRLQERSSSQEYVGYERNRYGFPRLKNEVLHFPKDMVSSQERSSS